MSVERLTSIVNDLSAINSLDVKNEYDRSRIKYWIMDRGGYILQKDKIMKNPLLWIKKLVKIAYSLIREEYLAQEEIFPFSENLLNLNSGLIKMLKTKKAENSFDKKNYITMISHSHSYSGQINLEIFNYLKNFSEKKESYLYLLKAKNSFNETVKLSKNLTFGEIDYDYLRNIYLYLSKCSFKMINFSEDKKKESLFNESYINLMSYFELSKNKKNKDYAYFFGAKIIMKAIESSNDDSKKSSLEESAYNHLINLLQEPEKSEKSEKINKSEGISETLINKVIALIKENSENFQNPERFYKIKEELLEKNKIVISENRNE